MDIDTFRGAILKLGFRGRSEEDPSFKVDKNTKEAIYNKPLIPTALCDKLYILKVIIAEEDSSVTIRLVDAQSLMYAAHADFRYDMVSDGLEHAMIFIKSYVPNKKCGDA